MESLRGKNQTNSKYSYNTVSQNSMTLLASLLTWNKIEIVIVTSSVGGLGFDSHWGMPIEFIKSFALPKKKSLKSLSTPGGASGWIVP